MIGSIVVLGIVGFVLWLALNAGTGFAATKLEFLEPDAPCGERGRRRSRRRNRRSALRVRYGPLSLRAKHILLAEKSLKMASGFLVGLYPVDVIRVQVDEYKVFFSLGLRKFIKAWWRGDGRERLAPRLVVRLVGVRVAIKGNTIEDWEKQTDAIAAGIEGMNHNQANLLTALIDKTSPEEGVPSTKINRLVDGIVNVLDIEVEGLHLSLASADHDETLLDGTQQRQEQRQHQHQQQQPSEPGSSSGGKQAQSDGGKHDTGAGWVLGMNFDYFRLCKKADPSEETLGITPRTLKLRSFNLYYDTDGTPVRRRDTSVNSMPRDYQHQSGGGGGGGGVVGDEFGSRVSIAQPGINTAVVRGEDPEVHLLGGTLPSLSAQSSASDVDDVSACLRQPDDHNSLLVVESIEGTLLFPDLMCVLLGVGRQPDGNGKLAAVNFEEMSGVVVELEPFQVFGLLNDALPLLALMGPYAEWCAKTTLQWHKEAFTRRREGAVPSTPEELEKYAKALGSVPGVDDGGGNKYKGNAAELRKLDKNMSLSQIMLARMRVRKWDVTRPERVMTLANLLLNSIDPFQEAAADDLAGDLVPSLSDGGGVQGGDDGERAEGGRDGGEESDEESPSVSSRQSETMLSSLQTEGPEEDARLESLLYYAAQQSAHAGAEGPVLMEIDVRMSAQNATVLLYHPPVDNSRPGENTALAAGSSSREVRLASEDEEDSGSSDDEAPRTEAMSRQNSGGSVKLGEGKGELATAEAMSLRDRLQLPALAASVVVDDFRFGFNLMMGSVACPSGGDENTGEGGPVDSHESCPHEHDPGIPAGANDPEEQGMPVQLHTFSDLLFPDARPIRLYKPSRLGQGADLRVESFGKPDEVGDGIAGTELLLFLGGTHVTDFGALADGGVLPTLIGGSAAAAAVTASADSSGDGGDFPHVAGGITKATVALFSGGRLEAGLDFQSCAVVALPGRIMAIIDVVLACLMGPPAAQKAQELDALEDEVEMEEAEEATGGVGTTEIIDSRWKAIEKVRGAYLFLGRMDARFSVRVNAFSLLLPQDSRDAHTNIVMAQCSGLALDMTSGSAFEALALDVCEFSIAPCVQHREAAGAAIVACGRLHEAGVAVALRGPLPELLGSIHKGFPLKDLDLTHIPERRIVLPVNMKINYSTFVTLRVEDTPEASTDTLVPDMVKINSSTDLAALYAASQGRQKSVAEDSAAAALSEEEEEQAGAAGDRGVPEVDEAAEAAAVTENGLNDGDEGGSGDAAVATANAAAVADAPSGLFVLMEVKLHVSSGLRVKVTDLDIAVLQGIAGSLMASLGLGQEAAAGGGAAGGAGGATGEQSSAAGSSLTYALDKAQRRIVASLRQAFRLADVNGDGTLDRGEVEALLRHNLQGHSLDPAQTEAEVLQFIALLDADGTETLDIDEFTSAMMRLMTDGPDEVTLERARRQALTKAFEEADADESGSLDAAEIMELLKNSDPLRTHSELDRQVSGYIEQMDADGDGQLDLEEFMELVHSMRAGDVHEGPLEPKAEEFRSWEVIRSMLEGFKTLPDLLAARSADYSPPGFWELFERETHATRSGSGGQLTKAVQAKMVKTFENYGFARDAWALLVAPAWYPGVVRVGFLAEGEADGGGGGGGGGATPRSVGPQHMSVPIRPGAPVYAQEHHRPARWNTQAVNPLSGMRIQRLPEELAAPPVAPPVVDPQSLSGPPPVEKFVTGVRLPPPAAGRGRRLSLRGSTSPPGVKMEIDRSCTLLVCFHDDASSTGVNSGGAGAGSGGGGDAASGGLVRNGSSTSSAAGSLMEIPKWATQMGLSKTSMHIETVLPGDGDGAGGSRHVYRVFSTPINRGAVTLGSGLPGSLPYFVLLYGGNHVRRLSTRGRRHSGVPRTFRAVTDSENSRRRRLLQTVLKKKSRVSRGSSGRRRSGRGSGDQGGGDGSSVPGTSRGSSSEAVYVPSAVKRGGSDESMEMTRTEMARATTTPAPERGTSMVSGTSSTGAVAAAANANPSWQLTPRFSLGGATQGVTSIATKADKNAKKAASSAMKIAAISSAGTAAAGAAGGGAGGVEVGKQPRVRLKATLLCEHGIFLQMDDLHRLRNMPPDAHVAPTFELALKVPPQSSVDGPGEPRSPGSLPSSIDEALQMTLDFEHVASAEILGEEDSVSMNASFGMEGRYFNPRVQQSEHFIEPWSMAIRMRDPRGDRTPRGQMVANRHFVLNVTTGLTSLACSIMESQDYAKTRYSTTSVYTELRDGAREGDDGSRLLTIENHLGVPVVVTLEDDGTGGDGDFSASASSAQDKARSFRMKKAGNSRRPQEQRRGASGGTTDRVEIGASLYATTKATTIVGHAGEGDGPPSDRISVGELTVPNAKKSLPTATVTVAAKGFVPVTGVPLDLLGRGIHAYRMTRTDHQNEGKGTRKWQFEGMVVKFLSRPTRNASVLDLAMQLQTNVILKNDMPRPLRVALSRELANEPNTVVPVDAEVCLPFPILHSKVLRLWKSPRTLVGSEALKKVLEDEAEKERAKRRSRRGGDGGGRGVSMRGSDRSESGSVKRAAEGARSVDIGDEISVAITSTTFDRNKKVVERHSQNMLLNGVSVERSDLGPTQGLVMHGSGDEAPALWRLYVRPPYVIQNGLACDIVVWASQPPPERDVGSGDASVSSPGSASGGRASRAATMKRRLTLGSLGRSRKKRPDGPKKLSSSFSSFSPKLMLSPTSWRKSSGTPSRAGVSPVGPRGTGGDATAGGRGTSLGSKDDDSDSNDTDDDDDDDDDDDESDDTAVADDVDSDDDVDQSEDCDEEDEELCSFSASDASNPSARGAAVGALRAASTGKVLWVLKSGEEAKLEGMDMTRNLRIRVGFAPGDGSTSCSDFCKPFVIEAKRHTNRTLLNRLQSKEAVFTGGARGSGGARRPEFKFGANWDHTPAAKYIHVYCKVWVVNKTGVSLAYRASMPSKDDDGKEKVFVRRPSTASYRTDGDTMLFSRYMTRGSKCASFRGGSTGSTATGASTGSSKTGGKASLPLMLTCPAHTLRTMPYAMADSAVGSPLLLSETRSSKSEQLLPCLAVPAEDTYATAAAGGGGGGGGGGEGDGDGGDSAASWPLYCDYPPARVRLAKEVVPEGRRRVHLLTMRSDTGSVTFTPSRDCRVYVGVDKRVVDAGAPKWLSLRGFERYPIADVAAADVAPADLAPQGFGLYSRFCRGLSIVPLGENVDRGGDTVKQRHSGSAAMYFVVVVSVPESEAVAEVDVGPVVMHRSVAKLLEFREHHRWRLKPNFKVGDPCYNDRPSSENTVTGLPEKLRGLKLMQIITAQGDKRVKANNMASFQTLQKSRVLVCFDSRASKQPKWLKSRGFRFQADMHLPTDPAGTGTNGYMVFAKTFPEGAEVKLGGNKASGAKRMYFVLVHAVGGQEGRISAPPTVARPLLAPPSPPNTELVVGSPAAAGDPDPLGESASATGGTSDGRKAYDELNKSGERKGGVVVESNDDQIFRFWDDNANGKLVQAPLDLDRQGRGWCEPFATDAVKTSGQAKSPAGVFGVTIEALSGAFLKTRVVTVWPRFVVRNNLGRKVGVVPTLEPPPKGGKDHGQSIARATKEEEEGLRNVQRASRKSTQPVPDGASVVLYDFTDPDDYDYDEEEDASYAATTGFSSSPSSASKPTRKQLQVWKRSKKGSKEDRLPCVRLMSGVHKDDAAERKSSGGGGGGSGDDSQGDGDGENAAANEQWVELPTVPVLLESMGKDTYVWMEGGRHQEDVLVRVSCRMLSNGATIHVVLSNETPSPPLRIENRSSTQTLSYRLGGDAQENVRLLEPMRWNSLHWVTDDERFVEVAVYTEKTSNSAGKHRRKAKGAARKRHGALRHARKAGLTGVVNDDDDSDSSSSSSSSSSGGGGDYKGKSGDHDEHDVLFSSFRWGVQGEFGDSPRRGYRADEVGRLKDLVGGKRKVGGEVRLKVECLRPPDSVVTTVLTFSDTPDGAYGKTFSDATSALSARDDGEARDADDDEEDPDGGGGEVESRFARMWTGLHFEASFAGLVLNIVDSTPSGPSEMAAFSVDNFEVGKPSGTPGVTLSVWHFQLDDMRADSPHPIILAPLSSGFNSHLTKLHYNSLSGSPAFRVEVERDVKVSLTHNMTVIRSIEVSLGKVHCSVHVDFWIDVQDVVFASLNWVNSSPEQARELAIGGTQAVVGQLLQAPAANATVDRIYIGAYHQEEIEVAVDFHLGTKVTALLTSKPPAEDEEKDEGGFGASLAMMPLGAAGGVAWGLLSSFGAGVANASPTFKFDAYDQEHYYGSTTQAVRLVVMSFVKQGVSQAYKVLGHIDILGDPLSLGKSISSGMIGFVTKTGAGHLGEGSKDLVKGVVGGAASSASKMTDALDNFVRGAGGIEGETPSGMEASKAPAHLGQGLTQGMMYFGHTVKDGITGVVMKPIRGAKKGGAMGFVQGVGKGVVGLVAAPVSATLGATSKITASIDATTRLLDDDPMGRRREPRHPLGLGEREDRDRLKKELKKKSQGKLRRRSRRSSGGSTGKAGELEDLEDIDELEEVVSREEDGGGGSGSDGGDAEDDGSVDTRAEAGGMGLLLLPLTPADMRTNYPDDYLERCKADMASKAGAVAIANAIEAELAAFAKNALEGHLQVLKEEGEEEKDTGEEGKAAAAAAAAVAAGSGKDENNGIEESKEGAKGGSVGVQSPTTG